MSESPRVYLDHNASSPLRPVARDAVVRALAAAGGNPSSVHREGRAARALVERAREQVAEALGGRPSELVWTASATEANNLALKGVVAGAASAGRRRLVVTATAHPSILAPARWLASEQQVELVELPPRADGTVDPATLEAAVDERTLLVSVLAANNEIGVLTPVPAVAGLARARGALLHVDASQALGRVPIDAAQWGVDLLTCSSHKVGGPPGAGALWLRPGLALGPLFHGGHQERNRRAGTEPAPLLAGFGAACQEAHHALATEPTRQRGLRDALWAGILSRVPDARWIGGDAAALLPNTLHVAFPGADGEALLLGLDLAGVAASSGSACTAGSLDPSHVLLAIGLPDRLARAAVRFSVGWSTAPADIERALALLPALVERARGSS